MSIRYALFENPLSSDPKDHTAKVKPAGTATLDDVIARMIDQGSTVVKSDILSVLESYYSAIESLVLEGKRVNTPNANYGASIRGTFEGQADSYDPNRHRVRGTVSPGKRYRKVIRERAKVAKEEAIQPRPNPLEYTDVTSEARNGALTPGGLGRVVGHRLKFDPTAGDQGIFFVAGDGTATRVEVVGRNKPTELIFTVPASLTSGTYRLEVRAVVHGSSESRTGALDAPLTVT
jgi:hypothetical protein